MNKKATDPLVAIHDAVSDLKADAEAAGANDVAFYLGAAQLAAEEQIARQRANRRSRSASAPSE